MGGLVSLRTYLDLEEAIVARSFLKAEGIDVEMQNECFAGVDPVVRLALGGYEFLVREEDSRIADALLREAEAGRLADKTDADLCKSCGGGDLQRRRSYPWAAAGFLTAVPYAPYRSLVCGVCGDVSVTNRSWVRAAAFIPIVITIFWWFFVRGYLFDWAVRP